LRQKNIIEELNNGFTIANINVQNRGKFGFHYRLPILSYLDKLHNLIEHMF